MSDLHRSYYTYIISNKKRTTLYIGMTNDIKRRTLEHKAGVGSTFSKRYKLCDLLYYEEYYRPSAAIRREKQLKNWHREWKFNLIRDINPELEDVAADWFSEEEIEGKRKDADTPGDKSIRDPETSSG